MAFGVKETVGTLLAGGVLFMVGFYAYVKIGGTIDLLDGGTYYNSTHYCASPGTITGGDVCNSVNMTTTKSAATLLPPGYAVDDAALTNIKSNVTSGFDLGSVVFIVLAAASIIGVIWLAFR